MGTLHASLAMIAHSVSLSFFNYFLYLCLSIFYHFLLLFFLFLFCHYFCQKFIFFGINFSQFPFLFYQFPFFSVFNSFFVVILCQRGEHTIPFTHSGCGRSNYFLLQFHFFAAHVIGDGEKL
jgi:hypothetical protein